MSKLPVSVCIIAGAEAHRIRPALESVAGWVSEIVLVLNEEVRDGTGGIAESFGAKVFREKWKGFIGQKNSALAKATEKWVLNIDADEVVSAALREEIQSLLASDQHASSKAGYTFPRCTFYCNRWIRHGDWYPDRVLRLWQRGKGVWGGVEPHASPQLDGPIGRLKSDLLHHSNESIDSQISKIAPYSQYFVEHCLKNERQIGIFDLAVRPFWKFLRAYVFKLGFLDGWPGYYIASLSAFSTVTRYAKVNEARLRQNVPK